jgi:hypothetical protein
LEVIAGAGVADTDTARTFIVNERFVQVVGFSNPEDIIGKNVRMWGRTLPIGGVVKNFHTVSLQNPIEATIMLNRIRGYRTLSVRLNPQSMQDALKEVQAKWERTYPEYIYSYRFLDEQIGEFYESEQRMSVMLSVFTSLAIFIGCLGIIRVNRVYGKSENQRNWGAQSNGRIGAKYSDVVLERVCKTYFDRLLCSSTGSVVCFKSILRTICV